jgi:hypothetical protein
MARSPCVECMSTRVYPVSDQDSADEVTEVFRCPLCLAPLAAFAGDPEAAFGAFEDHVREKHPGHTAGQSERQP